MQVGDLVNWAQGYCDIPGIVLETKLSRECNGDMNPYGLAVLAALPELNNDPEWFHECELEVISGSRE